MARFRMFTFVPVAVVFLVAAGGCGLIPKIEPSPDGGVVITGAGLGVKCATTGECRSGLVCTEGATKTCQPASSKKAGDSCFLSAECSGGLYCTPLGKCAMSGTTAENGSCSGDGDCMSGFTCARTGFYGTCLKAGAADLGATCTGPTSCQAGLICAVGKCQVFATAAAWPGAACGTETETAPKVYFKVPRASDPPTEDFFRLPFPNDIRKKDGKVSLKGFPRPGVRLLPFDPVDRFVKAIEAESEGFGLNTAIFFRFSRDPNFDSIRKDGSVAVMNITPASPEYGQKGGHQWSATTGRGQYICSRYITVRQSLGYPLRPGTTYAVLLRKTITDSNNMPMEADADFQAMLAETAPADADLAAAWNAYKPLRAWIADKEIVAGDIASAAVFTTEQVEDPLIKLRAAVQAAAAPEVKGLMKCGDAGKTSPCDDGKTGKDHERGCGAAADAKFDEYQGTISVPVFQKGTRPYEQPENGGAIEYEGSAAKIQGSEDVCFSLTVPKGTVPDAGWPVVVYGHGTGGSFRSHVDIGLASDFATGEIAAGGDPAPSATLGFDGVMHGPRRGASTRDPGELVYNFLNPPAARDNALQGAADLFVMARAVEGSFAAGGIKLDKTRVAVYGHSQGANAAAVAVGREPRFGAVVLSGSGGTLYLSFLYRKNPVNIGAALPVVLLDPVVNGDHPVLNLVQLYFERADPVNYVRRIFQEPATGIPARHFLHIFGTKDTYAPVETQRTIGQAGGLPVVGTAIDTDAHPAVIAAPAKANVAGKITAAQAQYNPDGYDGHFVSTQNPAARKALRGMLGTFFRDGTPAINP